MIKVAHVMYRYLGQSETFIWQYLNKFVHINPVVIAESLQNLAQFPLFRTKLYRVYGPRLTLLWFIDNWYRRVLKRPLVYRERIMRKEQIQVIHAHYGPVGCDYLPLAQSLNIPLITTFYGYDLSVTDLINQKESSYAELFKKGTCFLVEGSVMRKRLISLGCPEDKVFIQRIALDLEKYTFQTRSWDRTRRIRLLFTGRLVEKKGLEYALLALAKVKKNESFELRVIGGGVLEESLRTLAFSLGLTNEIVWLGVQPHQTVIEQLQSSDIVIQPSVTAKNGDSEGGAPTIILEAQA